MIHLMGRLHHGLYGRRYRLRGRRGLRYGHRRPWLRRRPTWGGPMPSQLVSWAQGCLAQVLGVQLPQDGLMGPDTQQAVQQFQTQQQLPPTGMLDSTTVSALQASCSGQQAMQDAPAPPSSPVPAPPSAQSAPPASQQGAPRRHGPRPPAGGSGEIELEPADGGPRGEINSGTWIRHRGGIIVIDL
jgi:peptidoglycan hydrolase-like protein with peptidoglycan-binding domain